MPWLKTGDSAATYPPLMQVVGLPGADERLVNEVAGWLWRCSIQAAAHMTDYRVDAGTAQLLGGARTVELVRIATRAGLITPHTDAQGMESFKIVEDPEFIHMRLRKEVEWDRQQRRDTRDPKLKAPVLARDGDNCRWCGVGVQWRGRTSNRTGTLDHLRPGEAGTAETMVVACKGCNSTRQDNPQWDDDHQLRPAPASPSYSRHTATYLTEHGYRVEETRGLSAQDERPGAPGSADNAAPEGARSAAPVATGAATAEREERPTGAATADARPRESRPGNEGDKSPPGSVRTSSVGSGRDGAVRVGTGGDRSARAQPTPQSGRRRGRRGSRGRRKRGGQ